MGRWIGEKALVVAALLVGVSVGVVAQHWSLAPSILSYPHWELFGLNQDFGLAGAESGMQIACGSVCRYPHWEAMRHIASALANTVATVSTAVPR